MLVLVAILLALIPAVAVVYAFYRAQASGELLDDESSPHSELTHRWEATLAGLANAELEWGLGNLSDEDYGRLRHEYIAEAARAMRAMQLEDAQEAELMATMREVVGRARTRALGRDGDSQLVACPVCRSRLKPGAALCPVCGNAVAATGADVPPRSPQPRERTGG